MQKEKADEIALQLAQLVIKTQHEYVLPQNDHYEQIADDVVSLAEALSERLQRSTLG